MDLQSYQPAPEALGNLAEVDFVAVVGPTAVGKTTLIKGAVAHDPNMHMLVAGTSRAPRPGEQDGIDFHFGTPEAMQARAAKGEYVTLISGVSGDLYTTAPEDYPPGKIVLLATLSSAVSGFRKLPYRNFRTIFMLPPNYEVWQQRLAQHGFDEPQLQRRWKEAIESITFGLQDNATKFMINDNLDVAIEEFIRLAKGHKITEDQQKARKLAARLRESILAQTSK
jgi:guanylate kinase